MIHYICFIALSIVFFIFILEYKETSFRKYKYENILILSLIIFVLGGCFLFSGLLTCGYHFMDDHQIYELGRQINDQGFYKTYLSVMKEDLTIRFRFTYYLIRLTEIFVLKDNLFLWHILYSIISIINIFLSYKVMRKFQLPIWLSVTFPVIYLCGGTQIQAMWALGLPEGLAVEIFMLCLLLLLRYLEKPTKARMIILIIASAFLGGVKESFLLLLPAFPLIALNYEDYILNIREKTLMKTIWKHIIRHRLYYGCLFVIFIVDIAIILLIVGTGYTNTGVGYELGIGGIGSYLFLTFSYWMKQYLGWSLFGILFVLVPCMISIFKKNGKALLCNYVKSFAIPLLLLAYILASQLFLHFRTGMTYRYLLPTTIFIAMFWMVDVYHINRKNKCNSIIDTCFYLIWIFIFIIYAASSNELKGYVQEGEDGTAMLEYVAEQYDGGNVIVLMEYEYDIAAPSYLQEKHHINNVYSMCVGGYSYDGFAYDPYQMEADETDRVSVYDGNIYICYEETMERLIEDSGLDLSQYERKDFGKFVTYCKLF